MTITSTGFQRGWRGWLIRWLLKKLSGVSIEMRPIGGGAGAGWTPIRHTVGTTSDLAADVNTKSFAGVLITTNGTSSVSILKTGTTAGSGTEVMRFLIPAVTAGETRYFPMPGLLEIQAGFNLDIDANVTNFTLLHT